MKDEWALSRKDDSEGNSEVGAGIEVKVMEYTVQRQ
jgi:hypothetical protein